MPSAEPRPLGDGRVEIAGELYHGIPCRVRIAGSVVTAEAGWAALAGIDAVFNVHRPDSELARINAAGPGVHRVSAGLARCLAVAAAVESASGGAWSACMLPAVRLWRAAAQRGSEPAAAQLAAVAALAHGAWRIEDDRLEVVHPGAAFDLGGIAKGFAVDLAVAALLAHGVEDLLVQAGGETASRGATHRIGIPHPDDPDGSWCAVLEAPADGLCGSTSAGYRLGHVVAGVRHHHILDGRSARSVASGVASASCVCRGLGRNALMDGLSGALAVLGPAALAGLCAGVPGCDGMILHQDAQRGLRCVATPGWNRLCATSDQRLATSDQ